MSLKNIIKRAPVTIIGIPSLIGLTLYTHDVFMVFFTIAGILILGEAYRMARPNGTEPNVWLGYLLYLGLVADQLLGQGLYLGPILISSILLLMTWEMFRNKAHVMENIAVTIFASAFVGMAMSYFILLQQLGYEGQGGHIGGYAVLTVLSGSGRVILLRISLDLPLVNTKYFPALVPTRAGKAHSPAWLDLLSPWCLL